MSLPSINLNTNIYREFLDKLEPQDKLEYFTAILTRSNYILLTLHTAIRTPRVEWCNGTSSKNPYSPGKHPLIPYRALLAQPA
jgi:hypothetical protein